MFESVIHIKSHRLMVPRGHIVQKYVNHIHLHADELISWALFSLIKPYVSH